MKNYTAYLVFMVASAFAGAADAQTINWASLQEQNRHIVNVHVGVEHGLVYGAGYGYQIKGRLFPAVVGIDYSFPSGDNLLDDFKVKVGGQIKWIEFHDFRFSTKIQGVFRRYENDLVRLVNFGSDLSGIIGYYRTKWFVAGEVGFDKAIVTHFKHSHLSREEYAGVVDGWYEPATGGNFYYGLQAGYSFRKSDLTIKAGNIISQDFKTKPLLPTYVQLGYAMRF